MVLKELILTVSTLGGCGGLERTDFNSFYFGRVSMVLKELIFNSLYIVGGCVVLKELILTVSGRVLVGVVILKELILTVSTFGGCGGLQRIDL